MKKPILIVLASKGRPDKIEGFYKTWRQTTEGYSEVMTSLDLNDPALNEYKRHKDISYDIGPGNSLCGTCNRVFYKYPDYKYYFCVSDDHRMRSKYWESRFMEKIESEGGKGVAYGNDLIFGEKLATSSFISGNIFRAMGFLAIPGLYHMWIDKFHLELGRSLGKLYYFPDIFIEHMHFTVNKSAADSSYMKVNNKFVYDHDADVFNTWNKRSKKKDIELIRSYKEKVLLY